MISSETPLCYGSGQDSSLHFQGANNDSLRDSKLSLSLSQWQQQLIFSSLSLSFFFFSPPPSFCYILLLFIFLLCSVNQCGYIRAIVAVNCHTLVLLIVSCDKARWSHKEF